MANSAAPGDSRIDQASESTSSSPANRLAMGMGTARVRPSRSRLRFSSSLYLRQHAPEPALPLPPAQKSLSAYHWSRQRRLELGNPQALMPKTHRLTVAVQPAIQRPALPCECLLSQEPLRSPHLLLHRACR